MSCVIHNCSFYVYLCEQNRLFCRIMGPCYDRMCVFRVHYDVILQCCKAKWVFYQNHTFMHTTELADSHLLVNILFFLNGNACYTCECPPPPPKTMGYDTKHYSVWKHTVV